MSSQQEQEQQSKSDDGFLSRLFHRKASWIFLILFVVCTLGVWWNYGLTSDSQDRKETSHASHERHGRATSQALSERMKSRSLDRSRMLHRPIDLQRLHEALEHSDHSVGLTRCGRLLREELQRTSAYGSVGRFLATLPEAEVKYLLSSWLIGSSTELGSVADYEEQKWLISHLGLSDDFHLTNRLYYNAGGRAFLELVSQHSEYIRESRVMQMALKGSAKHNGVEATLISLPALLADDSAIPAVKRGVEWLLASNSTEASMAIGNQPPGHPKDVMIEAMIGWLRKKGETDHITDWIELVTDPEIKKRLSEK